MGLPDWRRESQRPVSGSTRKATCHLLPELPGRPGQHKPFPVIGSYPSLSHLSFLGEFLLRNSLTLAADSPWAFFDPAGNTFNRFPPPTTLFAATTRDASYGIVNGISTAIRICLRDYALHRARMGNGINQTFERWAGR